MAINFPLSTAFAASHRFCYVVCAFAFKFGTRYFLISLVISSLTLRVFFHSHMFVNFSVFPFAVDF